MIVESVGQVMVPVLILLEDVGDESISKDRKSRTEGMA